MATQSYSDFELDYNHHLSKIRTFLAQPSTSSNTAPNAADEINNCHVSLQSAKQCLHAMLGIAEIEGDPFKIEESTRKLEREVGPLEMEIQERKRRNVGFPGGVSTFATGSGSVGISSVLGRPIYASGRSTTTTTDKQNLFGNLRQSSYIPPSADADLETGNNTSYEEDSLTTPLTTTPTQQQSIQNSEHLLRESQALCANSEQIGLVTLETMGRQREQLERSGYLLEEAMGNAEQARRILKEMARRAFKNKLFLYCIIGILLLANGAAIVHLWRRK